MRTAFVSYRRRDSRAAAHAIFDALVQEFGSHHVFRDVDSIPAGVDFRAVIEDEIVRSDVMVVVIGPQWLHITDEEGKRLLDQPGDFVRAEISRALELNLSVIGALVDGARAPTADELPPVIRPLAGCQFVGLSATVAASTIGVQPLVDCIRATPKATRSLTTRERYAATATVAWQAALASTILAIVGGTAAAWLAWYEWRGVEAAALALLAAMVVCGILVGWRYARWIGALVGLVLMPVATASALLLSLICVMALLLPLLIQDKPELFFIHLYMVLAASFGGNLSGLYGLKRVADARARRRKVSGMMLRVVGWWFLGVAVACIVAGSSTLLLGLGDQWTNPALNTLLGISMCCSVATPLGALFGLAWQWVSPRR